MSDLRREACYLGPPKPPPKPPLRGGPPLPPRDGPPGRPPPAPGLAPGFTSRLAGQQALALQALAGELAGAANGLGLLAHALLAGFLVVVPELHLPEDALALHLLLERLEGLIDVVIANLNQQAVYLGSVVYVAYAKLGLGSGNTKKPPGAHTPRVAELVAKRG